MNQYKSKLNQYKSEVNQHNAELNQHTDVDNANCCSSASNSFDKDEKIESIIETIREELGDNYLALAPKENITIPTWSFNYESYNDTNTVHVDNFIYRDEDVDELCEAGKLNRNICADCHSLNVQPASLHQLRWLFEVAIPSLGLHNFTLLDVGSRLGSVLYSAYLYSSAKKIIGVEINEYFHNLQLKVVKQEKLDDRISLYLNDITSDAGLNLLSTVSPQIIIFNNVFQFFIGEKDEKSGNTSKSKLRKIWEVISNSIRKSGTIVVSIPSLEEQFAEAESPIDLTQWVRESYVGKNPRELKRFKKDYGLQLEDMNDITSVFIYQVI
ncbi:hypothetical protein HDU92_001289 [Lobulomyces angularis]|nr:hypothetical protein HDU92_001289 [Lobulomyces angularis]